MVRTSLIAVAHRTAAGCTNMVNIPQKSALSVRRLGKDLAQMLMAAVETGASGRNFQ
jgi:hypothetical protein